MGCTGCGLVDTIGEIAIATSGEFGVDPLNYGALDTVGSPVYADEDGLLRTVPERQALVMSWTDGYDPAVSLDPGGTTTHISSLLVDDTYTTGDVRWTKLLFAVTFKFTLDIQEMGASGLALHGYLRIGDNFLDFAKLMCRPDVDLSGAPLTFPWSDEVIINEHYTVVVPPSTALTISASESVTVADRTATVDVSGYAVGLRMLAIEGRP